MTQRESKKTSAITNLPDSSMFAIQGRILTANERGRRERRREEQGNCRAMARAGTAVKAPAARAEEAGRATLLTRRHLGRPPAPQHRQRRAAPALSPRSSVPAVGRAGEPGSLSAAQLGPSRPPPASYSLPWARRAAAAEPWPGRSRAGLAAQPRRRPRRRWLPPGGGGEGGPGQGCFSGLTVCPCPCFCSPSPVNRGERRLESHGSDGGATGSWKSSRNTLSCITSLTPWADVKQRRLLSSMQCKV